MRKLLVGFLLCVVGGIYADSEVLSEPYKSMKVLPFDAHHWFLNECQLKACFKEKQKIETVIEVGSWLGGSARFFAENSTENAVVYVVDTWRGAFEIELYRSFYGYVPDVYHQFLSNTVQAGLTEKIIPLRMTSMQAAAALDVQADLIYIDGCHEEEAVYNDVIEWSKHLNEGGIMCGDDWWFESVRKGVGRAAAQLGKEVYVNSNFWRLY